MICCQKTEAALILPSLHALSLLAFLSLLQKLFTAKNAHKRSDHHRRVAINQERPTKQQTHLRVDALLLSRTILPLRSAVAEGRPSFGVPVFIRSSKSLSPYQRSCEHLNEDITLLHVHSFMFLSKRNEKQSCPCGLMVCWEPIQTTSSHRGSSRIHFCCALS